MSAFRRLGSHSTITLRCWVYRDDVEKIFPVEMSSNKTVKLLKEIIKERTPEFRDQVVKDLQLYSIPITRNDDKHLRDELKHLSLEDKSPLKSSTKVSKILPESHEGDVEWLIVVYRPNSASRTTTPASTVPDITLKYWVRGESRDRAHSVQIPSTDTVGDLQKAIKHEKAARFRDIDPDDLTLYKASFPYGKDNPLKGVLGDCTISALGEPLESTQKLSAIFMPPPANGQLHLIVDSSLPLPLECWIRGADPASSFTVEISMMATVGSLKNVIRTLYGGALGNPLPDQLKPYKIPIDGDTELQEILGTQGSGQLLRGSAFLGEVFDDVPFSRIPCVVIDLLDQTRSPLDVSSQAAVDLRLQYIQAWTRNPPRSPSQQGQPLNFKILQSTDRRIEWTRPPEGALATPVTLLHPVFGQFVDDCGTHEPTSEDNTIVLDLSLEMSRFFENEKQRQDAFINILRGCSIGIVPSAFAGFETNRDLHVNGRRYMILEVKSEVGSKGAEPYCQAILYYIGLSKDEVEKTSAKDVQFNFPCLIVTLFGPHLGFSGAVWANRPNYQVLSTVLPLFWHPTDTMMRQSAARHIGAFMKACRSLHELYKKFDQTPGDFKDLQLGFPHPRCYTSLDGENQEHFRYIRTLEASKLLFVVKTDAGEQLCIKFVRTYDQTVHQQCTAQGMSPSLRGFNAVPGGWYMVVMDLLEEYECLCDVKHSLSREEKKGMEKELRSKLKDLHEMGFVHGDVRDANIMVRKDRLGWMLVDFDWSGKIGEVRYPMNVNRAPGLWRPEGVLDGKPILADHDIKMLDYLFD